MSAVEVRKISWLGTRTHAYGETVAFFEHVLGLRVRQRLADFAVLELPDGATVEVFGPTSAFNRHLTHPVAGFLVTDLRRALGELERAGAEIVLPMQSTDDGAWLHVRGPDGFVYELTEKKA